MELAKVVNKMVKTLTKAGRNVIAAKHQESPEIKKIYLRKAQDRYDYYTMWNDVLPVVARQEMGAEFDTQDKMFLALRDIFTNWAEDIKEDIDKAKMM